jgi:hypothetical protein
MVSCLLGCDTELLGTLFPTFRRNVSPSPSRVEGPWRTRRVRPNIGNHLPSDAASQPTRPNLSITPLRKVTTRRNGHRSRAAFFKPWSADHKLSSGSALVVLLDWTLVQKIQKNININIQYYFNNISMLVLTYAENIKKNDKFAFKGDKSRVVRRTFWLIKVVPTWKSLRNAGPEYPGGMYKGPPLTGWT